jgi:hypothetical protein
LAPDKNSDITEIKLLIEFEKKITIVFSAVLINKYFRKILTNVSLSLS